LTEQPDLPQLINAYDADGQWYRANFHCHAGEGASPEELIDAYRAEGISVLGISNHYVRDDYSHLSTDDFLLIPCEETGDPHALSIGAHLTIGRVPMGRGSVAELDRRIREAGGLMVLAHPPWSGLSEHDVLEGSYLSIEVFNQLNEFANGKGRCVELWDRLLCAGRKVWGFAGDDAHVTKPFQGRKGIGGGFCDLLLPELSREAVIDALVHGRFTASMGPRIRDVRVEGTKLVVECTPCVQAHFASRSFGAASEFAPYDEPRERFEMDLIEKRTRYTTYIRVEVIDRYGRSAWTNPLLVKDSGFQL
jgi:hypothetical protein